MFLISKLIQIFLIPSNLIALVGLVGLLAMLVKRGRLARVCIITSVLLLIICGWSPVGPAALMALENRFPQPVITRPITGIVLLGGAVDPHISIARGNLTMNEAGERLTAAVDLSRRYPDARIFLSGGLGQLHGPSTLTESELARDILVSLGVAPSRIAMEERSRTTCENATESAASIRPQPGDLWLLVTSAYHMPRAVACFRAAGFEVTPYPVDYRTRGETELKRPTNSIAVGLAETDLATHEWLGLLSYRIGGLTDELFPSPH